MKLIDKLVSFEEDHANAALQIVHAQEIPEDFLDALADYRSDTLSTPMGEFHRVASIPVSVWEDWIRQGRDPQNASVPEIMKWLHESNMQKFKTTERHFH